jgi:hypothetical protein
MRCTAFVFLGLCLSLSLQAQPKPSAVRASAADDSAAIAEQIKASLATEERWSAPLARNLSEQYARLFDSVGAGGIRELQSHRCDSIALQAAWQEVLLTVSENEAEKTWRPDRPKLDWFLGFLEGRARVQAPKWWAEMLVDLHGYRRDEIHPGQPAQQPYHDAGFGRLSAPGDTTLKKNGGKVVLQVGDESISMPDKVMGNAKCISAAMTSERCYVAAHSHIGSPFELTCIDRASTAVVWKATVGGTFWGGASGTYWM